MLLKDFGATAIACTPSYALYLAEELKTAGLTTDDLMLKTGIFGAEPWTEEMRREIEDRLKIEAFDIYGLSEISGPGVAMDAPFGKIRRYLPRLAIGRCRRFVARVAM